MPITVIATFHAADGKRDALLEAVCAAVPGVLLEQGCLQYAPHTVGQDKVMLVESWESPEALRAHSERPGLGAFRESISDFIAAPTEIVVARPVAVPVEGIAG